MADQPITGLPTKTASGVATTDKMLGIDSAEGYQILVQDVAKYIIENYGGSTLAGAARTPKAAIDLLNSNTIKSTSGNHVVSTLFDSSFIVLRFSDGTSFTNLVFYDNGKVELTRWADDQWKASVVLRQADS